MLAEQLPEEVQLLAKVAHGIAHDRIAPLVREMEDSGQFCSELRDVLSQAGWLAMGAPSELSYDLRSFLVVVEEVSKVFPTASSVLLAHWFALKTATKYGAGAWFSQFKEDASEGRLLGAIAATEPDSGSDLASLSTVASRTADGWKISGSKRFITNGGLADFYVVLARSGSGGHQGISAYFVPAATKGLSIGRLERKLGLRASATAELHFDDVEIPHSHLLGKEGSGFIQAMDEFVDGRILVAAVSTGIATAALDVASAYAADRKQFGAPISSFQGIQFMLADMAIAVSTARSITLDASEARVMKLPEARILASIAKTYASDTAMRVTIDAVQVLGGSGYTVDTPVEMLMRDAKINQIYEGTNQIQRMLIARELLKAIGS